MTRTILILEDDHETRVALRDALEESGYKVHTTTNGLDAIALVRMASQMPDLILLDQNMPLMSGDEFLILRSRDEKLAQVPVIAISAVENRVAKYGVRDFLSKPVDITLLLHKITACLNAPANPLSSTRRPTSRSNSA